MPGITAYGAYLPRRRLQRSAIAAANTWFDASLRGLAPRRAHHVQLGRGHGDDGRGSRARHGPGHADPGALPRLDHASVRRSPERRHRRGGTESRERAPHHGCRGLAPRLDHRADERARRRGGRNASARGGGRQAQGPRWQSDGDALPATERPLSGWAPKERSRRCWGPRPSSQTSSTISAPAETPTTTLGKTAGFATKAG